MGSPSSKRRLHSKSKGLALKTESVSPLFRIVGWVAIFVCATFLGEDFVISVVNGINAVAPMASP